MLVQRSINGNAKTVQTGNNNKIPGSPGGFLAGPPTKLTNKSRRGSGRSKLGWGRGISGGQFTQLNNLISSLDATYDSLLDKLPWESLALDFAGDWDLCANCTPEAGGKKLFRQINFNRLQLGLPILLVPDGSTDTAIAGNLKGIWDDRLGSDDALFDLTGFSNFPLTIIAQLGDSLNNPTLNVDADLFSRTWPPGSSQYQFVQKAIAFLGLRPESGHDTGMIKVCAMLPNGYPGKSAMMQIIIFHN